MSKLLNAGICLAILAVAFVPNATATIVPAGGQDGPGHFVCEYVPGGAPVTGKQYACTAEYTVGTAEGVCLVEWESDSSDSSWEDHDDFVLREECVDIYAILEKLT